MPIRGVKQCGAKCRTKGGAPCEQLAMKNGSCRMHGGVFFTREKHERMTLKAKYERKMVRAFLSEMKGLSREIERKT